MATEAKFEIYDADENKVIKFDTDAEFIEFVNKEQEKIDAHNFIIFTVSQCRGYIMNWSDHLKMLN